MKLALLLGAASLAAGEPALAQEGYVIKPLRWDEDYARYQAPAHATFPETWKHVSLSEAGAFGSFGGEARARTETYDEPLFGMRGLPDFTSTAIRLLFHADIHANADVRAFIQLGVFDETGRKPRERPADESALDLAQGFIDIGRPQRIRVRLGRQELSFGRFVTIRDGTNIRRTFDGARLTTTVLGGELDAFAATTTRQQRGFFDDDPDPDDRAWGAAFRRPTAHGATTITYFGRHSDNAVYAVGTGVENRHSAAVRLQAQYDRFDFDGQAGVQWGQFELSGRTLDIRAWGFASEIAYRLAQGSWSPRLALRFDAASGDADAADDALGTFDLGYPNLTYLTDAAAFAPRNLIGVQPFLTVQPKASLTLTFGTQWLWRLERNDAVYAPPSIVLAPGGGSRFAASEYYGRAVWRLNRHVEMAASAVWIDPGSSLTAAGGNTQTFVATQITTRF